MKICILGGGGCFGLNFARLLGQNGANFFGIGRSGPKHPAFWQAPHGYRFTALHLDHELDYVLEKLDAERPNVVVNFAAQGEGAASFSHDSWRFYQTNTVALVKLVEQLRKRDYLERFIQIGTSELYGSVTEPADENAPQFPSSPYAISKAAFDQHLVTMHRIYGFPMNIIRPSNCYTPGQQLHRVIPRAIIYGMTGRRLQLHGGGKAEKSYLDATDLSQAIIGVIDTNVPGKIYNCGPAHPIAIRKLVSIVADALSLRFADLCEDVADRVGQDGKYWLDSTALAMDTGWTQTVGIERGVESMVKWVKLYPELLSMDDAFRMRD
jgi:dTDP-glucose 4,6-dehydratase